MARQVTFTVPASGTATVAASQASAATLTINGTLRDLPATMNGVNRVILAGIERTITLTSGDDLSANAYTISGYTLSGLGLQTTITGPNATTVATSTYFNHIQSVTRSGAAAGTISVGTGPAARTNWWLTDTYATPGAITVEADIASSTNVTVRNTFNDPAVAGGPVTFSHATISGVTSSIQSNYAYNPGYVQGVVNSVGGAVTFNFIQQG